MRLIDADALLDSIENPYQRREIASWINSAPVIEERKRGKWLPDNTDIRMYYVCSECKQATQIPKYVGGFLYNFCPNCGARMEGNGE